jgi:DNA glycosylase/AP lyase, H2TH DNA-binding protein
VRLRLLGEHGVADLTGPAACELLNAEEVAAVHGRLGPDPLRADADPDEFVAGAQRRRKAVGELLMDQSVISGVGNIFRAETLLRCGINPFLEGNRLSREQLLAIWDDLVPLMEYGVATGFITTVDPDDVPQPLPDDDPEAGRWYVYHRAGRACLRCGRSVCEREVVGRRLFWCPGCQCCQS